MKVIAYKIAIALLSLVVLVYVIYQGYMRLNDPYETEIVFRYIVSDSLRANGIVVRDEYILDHERTDAVDYLYADGERVSKRTTVANLYTSVDDIADRQAIEQLQAQVDMLEASAKASDSYYATADSASKQIIAQLVDYQNVCESRFVEGIYEQKNGFLLPVNKRLTAGEKQPNIAKNLQQTQAELDRLIARYGTPVDKVTTPRPGYFVSSIDGYENLLTTRNYDTYSVSDYQALIRGQSGGAPADAIGKIVTDPNWLIAVEVPADTIDSFYIGRAIDIDFPFSQVETVVSTVYDTITSPDNASAVVLLRASAMSENLATARVCTVQLKFRTITGLRFNKKALRFNAQYEQGVYVVSGEQVVFKKVDILYEGNGFYLASYNEADKDSLQLYDEIILEGVALEKQVTS